MSTTSLHSAPPAPFDALAATYDELFTHSLIGQAQRDMVWKHIDQLWMSGDRVLELNCGTGEDALHLASKGINVTACDASAAMIAIARERMEIEARSACVEFHTISNEHLDQVSVERQFDGVLSNFSGLNCVHDLDMVARQLAALVRREATLALCLSTRFCAWEFLWYALRGDVKKGVRRWKGQTLAHIGDDQISVWYPTMRQLSRAFAPWFQLEQIVGIGTAIPPSYAENWASEHPGLFNTLKRIDRRIHTLPLARVLGDHVLLRFRRCPA
jgi:2-polyprenyl-3-methyl-5-hydroxy-6-metoxy-1,4-benzoquinol methylase